VEKVDILKPPTFEKSGIVKSLEQAWDDEDWIGTFNLWIVQDKPIPSIVYQQRSLDNAWAPGKLDVTAGGHYSAGEEIKDGMREVEEELGKRFRFKDLKYFGRKIHVSPDVKGRERHNVVDIFMIKDISPLESYKLQESEVYAICACPIEDLIKVHSENRYEFIVRGIRSNKEKIETQVTKDSFPYNWDNYHFKITLLAERFLKGEKNLIY
jgi:hypothetical protein